MKIKVVEITPSPEHERWEDAAPGQGNAHDQGSGAPPGSAGTARAPRRGAKAR